MESRPVQRSNEKPLAFYNRVNEWESRVKPLMAAEARAIDSTLARAPITTRGPVVSKQREQDRRTLHDYARDNDVLRRILRKNPHLCV